ncbi:hypothetical protein GCM10010499_34800 [Streptomyces thermoviolaceus subsp. apingens]|nr:hypothetical protein GCM10010499_34800 [Streptomyces thermoviolaceus subsp. apingens]
MDSVPLGDMSAVSRGALHFHFETKAATRGQSARAGLDAVAVDAVLHGIPATVGPAPPRPLRSHHPRPPTLRPPRRRTRDDAAARPDATRLPGRPAARSRRDRRPGASTVRQKTTGVSRP